MADRPTSDQLAQVLMGNDEYSRLESKRDKVRETPMVPLGPGWLQWKGPERDQWIPAMSGLEGRDHANAIIAGMLSSQKQPPLPDPISDPATSYESERLQRSRPQGRARKTRG